MTAEMFALGYLLANTVFWAAIGFVTLKFDLDTEPLERLTRVLTLFGLSLLVCALVLKLCSPS